MGGKHAEESHLNLLKDCVEICKMSSEFMERDSDHSKALCKLCAEICDACAKSCEELDPSDKKMADCAKACRECAKTCREMAK